MTLDKKKASMKNNKAKKIIMPKNKMNARKIQI